MRQEQARKLVKELYKHAQRDDCYECKQILKAMGLNPKQSIFEGVKKRMIWFWFFVGMIWESVVLFLGKIVKSIKRERKNNQTE